ncbi:hypothetical protein [Methylotenera sp.]|uniref:hypothetical protein n=1 Tax=Methylotenera sp. TaxID=2051956 RepID=UPI0024890358|nr:hypothetical protein [Methylotenera sp.]MDI1299772.1 hypothetical protein [Methylotenera sp.]
MDISARISESERLVHFNYGAAYGRALEMQRSTSSDIDRKELAATLVAERFATSNRDTSIACFKEVGLGRDAMSKAYGVTANDVESVLSGRVADYDLAKNFGSKDFNALSAKGQLYVQQHNIESFASRGRVEAVGFSGNFLSSVQQNANESKEKLIGHLLHVRSSIDAGVDRGAYEKTEAKSVYDRFEKATFDPSGKKASSSQLFNDFEKSSSASLRRDVSFEVEMRYAANSRLVDRARTNEGNANLAKANDFRRLEPVGAVKKHPDLVPAFAALYAASQNAEVKFGVDGKAGAVAIAKENLALNIEKGVIPQSVERDSSKSNHMASADSLEL